jgi:uncharacterized membrane protein YhaH (DUF805 family)
MNWSKFLFSAQGRIGRRSYWLFMGLSIAVGLIAGVIDGFAFSNFESGPVAAIMSLASVFPSICIQTKRLHDLGRSGWFQLVPILALLPAVSLFFGGGEVYPAIAIFIVVVAFGGMFIWLGFFKGQPGPNKYGEPNSGDRDVTPTVEVFS